MKQIELDQPDAIDSVEAETELFTIPENEHADENFQKLIARLEAGEKIPGVCLTDHGTVAFWIP